MSRVSGFFNSMTGRIFLISVVGVIGSAAIATGLATAKRQFDVHRLELERLADRVQDYYLLVDSASPTVAAELVQQGIPKLRPAIPSARGEGLDSVLTSMIQQRLGAAAEASAETARPEYCVRKPAVPYPTSLDANYETEVDCWLVRFKLRNGTPLRLMYLEQRAEDGGSLAADPVYLAILIFGAGLAALLAARMAAAPLHRLAEAALALGNDLDRSPLPEKGPSEVSTAARAFNMMQTVLRRHLKQRHQMLASITHDLQTPLTRLRLRADKVADAALRDRMLSDLAAMQRLIREGLELAQGDVVAEPTVRFDLDSLLESITYDAADEGHDVHFAKGCGCAVVGLPHSLRRAISNLVQNAVQYAEGAELIVSVEESGLKIIVRDHGPGIPDDQLQAVLEPFVRLETSRSRETGGVGLGLTIAYRLAERNGGALALINRPGGGLDAVISLPPTRLVRTRSRQELPA